jgi:hypothetical protein
VSEGWFGEVGQCINRRFVGQTGLTDGTDTLRKRKGIPYCLVPVGENGVNVTSISQSTSPV